MKPSGAEKTAGEAASITVQSDKTSPSAAQVQVNMIYLQIISLEISLIVHIYSGVSVC